MHQSDAIVSALRALSVALLFAVAGLAQSASIHGSVTDHYGVAVRLAPVQAKNLQTGFTLTVSANERGQYKLSNLQPGTYEVSVDWIAYRKFLRGNIVLKGKQDSQLDISLEDTEVGNTPGELVFRHSVGEPVKGQAPRTAEDKPDFSGVWLPGPEVHPELPDLLPISAAIMKQRTADGTLSPRALCLPTGIVRTTELDLVKLVQTPKLLVVLVEGGDPGFRQIFLDGRPHPADVSPTWLGHSVGRWEGDTLVVDTVGFNDKVWLAINGPLNGVPQTEQMHLVERIDRPSLGQLHIEYTMNDPGSLAKPWKVRRTLTLAPNDELQEYLCSENNKDPQHMEKK